jgi:hypothetical protein
LADAEVDHKSKSFNTLWFAGWEIVIYVLSYVPMVILAKWLDSWGYWPHSFSPVFQIFYAPINRLIYTLGLVEPLVKFLNAVFRHLPQS